MYYFQPPSLPPPPPPPPAASVTILISLRSVIFSSVSFNSLGVREATVRADGVEARITNSIYKKEDSKQQ